MSLDSDRPEESGLSEKQIAGIVKYLNAAFFSASNAYRNAKRGAAKKVTTFVFREPKTLKPILEEGLDYTLYNAQIEFAYMIDAIQRGPVALASIEIKKCNDLIDSISL